MELPMTIYARIKRVKDPNKFGHNMKYIYVFAIQIKNLVHGQPTKPTELPETFSTQAEAEAFALSKGYKIGTPWRVAEMIEHVEKGREYKYKNVDPSRLGNRSKTS